MRIKQDFHDESESYSAELQGRVTEIFQNTSRITEIKRLLTEIRDESIRLRELFLTEDEKKEREKTVSDFDAKMQEMMYGTIKNLEDYQQFGWKQLIYEEGDTDEGVPSTL